MEQTIQHRMELAFVILFTCLIWQVLIYIETTNFSVSYPTNWFFSEEKKPTDSGETTDFPKIKKAIHFSNYENIEQYSPKNKPVDFHLVSLIIYEKTSGKRIGDLALILGFDTQANSIVINDFKTQKNKVVGKKFITQSEEIGSPMTKIFFEKDNAFFVFNFGFIGGNEEVAEIMNEIASSLEFSSKNQIGFGPNYTFKPRKTFITSSLF